MTMRCFRFVGILVFVVAIMSVVGGGAAAGGEEESCTDDASNNTKPSIVELFSRSREEIQDFLGSIYEESPWVAEQFLDTKDKAAIESVTDLAGALKDVVDGASRERKMELLLSHPDLCERTQKKLESLTQESQDEQSSAGLQSLSEEEFDRFTKLNDSYREKFGFPFILAVRGASKYTVLAALEGRLSKPVEVEFVQALAQVHKIAWMRLLAALDTTDAKGYLTCHVLDTANGVPAANMRVRLVRLSPPEAAGLVGDFVTNEDGRLEGGPALKGGKEFTVGTYEWTFYTAEYFASTGTFTSGTPFLDEIPLRFGIDNPDDHYHVPLLVSPWSFSTYRGS